MASDRHEYFRSYMITRRAVNRTRILDILGGKCVSCGFSDRRALQLDHINGDGPEQLRRFKTRNIMIEYYLVNQHILNDNIQLLCANCNWIKRDVNREGFPRKYK